MDVITIFSALYKWGKIAAGGGAILFIILLIGNQVYKKILPGRKTLGKVQLAALFFLICWFLLVISLTILSRGAGFTGSTNITFFSGYMNAWNQWSTSEFQLIIFNMLMFFPLGFLLPLLWKRAEKLKLIIIASLVFTSSIELIQLISGHGIFELDDLFNNFIGSLMGYFFIMAILGCIRQKKIDATSILRAFIIPGFVSIIVGIIFINYELQPYGNMPILPSEKINIEDVEIQTELDFSKESSRAAIYQNILSADKKHMEQLVQQISELEDITFSNKARREGENSTMTGENPNGIEFSFTYFTRSGTWWISNTEPGESVPLTENQINEYSQKYESWLSKNSLLPKAAEFSIQNNDTLRWDCTESEDLMDGRKGFCSGGIMLQLDDQENLLSLHYFMNWNKFITTEEIISPSEAYEKVLDGEFYQFSPFQQGDLLVIEEWEIAYTYDTKGFYQPVYEFRGYINDSENVWVCNIPARKGS